MSVGKPVVKLVDMDEEMKTFSIREAQKAMDIQPNEKLVASWMKKQFEK